MATAFWRPPLGGGVLAAASTLSIYYRRFVALSAREVAGDVGVGWQDAVGSAGWRWSGCLGTKVTVDACRETRGLADHTLQADAKRGGRKDSTGGVSSETSGVLCILRYDVGRNKGESDNIKCLV